MRWWGIASATGDRWAVGRVGGRLEEEGEARGSGAGEAGGG
jgi:hypothetical protein